MVEDERPPEKSQRRQFRRSVAQYFRAGPSISTWVLGRLDPSSLNPTHPQNLVLVVRYTNPLRLTRTRRCIVASHLPVIATHVFQSLSFFLGKRVADMSLPLIRGETSIVHGTHTRYGIRFSPLSNEQWCLYKQVTVTS